MTDAAIDAMDALLRFSEAMDRGQLSIRDLREVMTSAGPLGTNVGLRRALEIKLAMVQVALRESDHDRR